MSEHRNPSRAHDLYDDYLRRRAAGEPLEFKALCVSQPELAAELQQLHSTHALVSGLLPGPLEQKDAPDEAPPPTGEPSSALWEKLRGKTPQATRYRVLGELGRGGMGVVLKVWDEELRRPLAMKVVRPEVHSVGTEAATRTLGRFLEEAQVTGQLDHPGIVPLHEIGLRQDGVPYYTMRLVDGVSFRTVVDHVQSGTEGWTQVRALGVLLKACEAMSYAHSRGVIHRDLKPANIMVGQFGEVYVMDWGLARVLGRPDSHDLRIRPSQVASSVRTERREPRVSDTSPPLLTLDGEAVGTPHYMSPEQARGQIEQLGPHSDVYSVGAMLYQLITGEMPYASGEARRSPRAVLDAAAAGPPRPIHESGRQAPAELAAICDKAMARNWNDRYPDMRALAQDLSAYLEGRVVRAYETGAWAETRKWLRRNRALAASLAAVVVVLAVGSVSFLRSATLATERRDVDGVQNTLSGIDELERVGNAETTPSGTEPMTTWWLRRAGELVEGRDRSGSSYLPGLREVERLRDQVRRRALPRTAAQCAADRQGHPRSAELQYRLAELRWYAQMLGIGPFPQSPSVEEALQMAGLSPTASAAEVNVEAWRRVDPRNPVFGQEQVGLVLARHALALTATDANAVVMTRDTLAWASYRVRDFAQARGLYDANGETPDAVRDGQHEMPSLIESIRSWEDGTAAREYKILDEDRASLERDSANWRNWEFADLRDSWWHEQLDSLVRRLERLEQRLRAGTVAASAVGWDAAIAAIAALPTYGGLHIARQLDLLPLGPDPESGLWEFAHLPSGSPPARRAVDGKLIMLPESGLVFVLVPRGRDCPEPFLLSKYEMTIAQWERLSHRWVCLHGRALSYPMNRISFEQCTEVLRAASGWLHLPSIAEWQHARRGNTTTRYWTGEEVSSLRDAENIKLDPTPGESAALVFLMRCGSLRANPFGLYDMEGNLAECCRDAYGSVAGDGQRDDYPVIQRASCGYYFNTEPNRPPNPLDRDDRVQGMTPTSISYGIGLRPARWLTR